MQIKLTKPQTKVWRGNTRFKVLICGRRFGKTFFALTWLLAQAGAKKGIYYYIAPSYVMAKSIAWRLLKELADGLFSIKNESELFIELPNGSVIQLKGAENRDSLRGVSLAGAVLDEYCFMSEEVWTEVVRPATSDQLAPVVFISSPAGWNWAKDLYDYAMSGDDENWQAWTFTTADGGNVALSEIEAARRELPERTFKQEYLASFETLSNRVYSNFDRGVNISNSLLTVDDTRELFIGIDFNVSPVTAAVGVKVVDQLHIIDEISIENSNTTELAQEIKRRYPNHKIRAYPDPAGRARKTSAAGGVTDFVILEQFGFITFAPKAHDPVADRINTVQAMLRNAKGESRLFIHPRCKELIKGLDGMTYKKDTNLPDKSLGLDHITDALGYLVCYEFPINAPISAPLNWGRR
jgi:hypothetical protein